MQYLSRPCTAVSHNSHTVRESLVLSKNSSPDMLRMIIQEGQAVVVCLPIVALYIFLSLYLIIFHGSNYEFSWGEQLLHWSIAASTCIGSYVGIRSVNS